MKSSCPYLLKEGIFTVLPFLFTKSEPDEVFSPCFVIPWPEIWHGINNKKRVASDSLINPGIINKNNQIVFCLLQ